MIACSESSFVRNIRKKWINSQWLRICVGLRYKETSNKLSTGIDSIENIGEEEYFGITLKAYGDEKTDNLFLLEDFTIVHNCGSFPKLITTYNQSEALVNLLGKKIGTRLLWGTGGDHGS